MTARESLARGADPSRQAERARIDPRWYQITVLGTLLLYGLFVLRFDVTVSRAALAIVTVLVVQLLCSRSVGIGFEPKSALISGLSLCLLLRASEGWIIVLAGVIAIASKFLIRFNGKHIFNPTNIGIAAVVFCTDGAWVSPGQWGSEVIFAAFLLCAGGTVIFSAARSDITVAFILSYGGLLVLRAARLGDPISIPLHQLANGAFVIFAFFMISDPRSTPSRPLGRVLFASAVALAAYYIRFTYYTPNALIYALAICSPLTILVDRALPGGAYRWDAPRADRQTGAGFAPAAA